jgi:hypothetical protein
MIIKSLKIITSSTILTCFCLLTRAVDIINNLIQDSKNIKEAKQSFYYYIYNCNDYFVRLPIILFMYELSYFQ